MSLLGIDVGTTGCKTAVYGDEGACLATAYREYPTLHPKTGWAMLDSRQVLAHVFDAIAEVAAQTRNDPISALCVSSMGEAMIPVNVDRAILGDSILHVGTRGVEYARRLEEELGAESVYAVNPNIIGPNYSLPKLLWIREHEPELFQRADKFLLWGDLVGWMLGSEPLTSYSLANRTLLFDIHRACWSDLLLQWADVDPGLLPRPVPSGTSAGTVDPRIAGRLGLPAGTKIIVGGHDQCCGALGAGVCASGKACCGMGTVECITPVFERLPASAEMFRRRLSIEHHALPDLYVTFLYNQSGSLVRWFRDTFAASGAAEAGLDIFDRLMAEMPETPTRLLVLPHFEMTGTPHFLADSAGAIAGLHTNTTRGDILKAILEGAAFYFLDSLDAIASLNIPVTECVATGGGARSAAWLQIKADIYGIPFVRPRITECGALGAAMLAGIATGRFSADDAVTRFVATDRVFDPDPARHREYRERAALFRALYPALCDIHQRLA